MFKIQALVVHRPPMISDDSRQTTLAAAKPRLIQSWHVRFYRHTLSPWSPEPRRSTLPARVQDHGGGQNSAGARCPPEYKITVGSRTPAGYSHPRHETSCTADVRDAGGDETSYRLGVVKLVGTDEDDICRVLQVAGPLDGVDASGSCVTQSLFYELSIRNDDDCDARIVQTSGRGEQQRFSSSRREHDGKCRVGTVDDSLQRLLLFGRLVCHRCCLRQSKSFPDGFLTLFESDPQFDRL